MQEGSYQHLALLFCVHSTDEGRRHVDSNVHTHESSRIPLCLFAPVFSLQELALRIHG